MPITNARMNWFKNLAIGIKLNLMVVSTTFVVLLAVLGVVVGFDIVNHRELLTRQAEILCRITSNNLTAPLSFNDAQAAEEVLNSLRNQPDIIDAVLQDSEGREFAAYRSVSHAGDPSVQGVFAWVSGNYHVESPVELKGQRLGTVGLTLTLRSLEERISKVSTYVGILFALGLLAATALTHYFKRSITRPLSNLTDLAKEVSSSKNYSLRLFPDSTDELGVLVNSFNRMMEEVSIRDRALESHKANLELQVIERTAEYKRAQDEAIEANKAKSQFLANMSHEIRTPLNGILGMTELASELAISPEQREYLTIVQQSSLSLLAIINDILDFSKIEAGKLELTPVQFDLRRSVDRVLALMAIQADTKGLTLEAEVLEALSSNFVADEGRIRQVLVNLVGNAIKFTPSGGKIVIRLHGVKLNNEFEKVIFEVIDTGIGIPPEKHQQIFEAFAQADGSISRKFGGSGLGLSICRMIVELMGGKIWVESKPGEGSKFSFEIPMKVATSEDISRDSQKVEPALAGINILLVEDNQVNQKIAQKLLGKRGVAVTTANDGAEALVAWREGTFDLILMDCQMPVMSGYDSTRSIRREELAAGKNRIPIIALTAQALSGDREECLAAGMDGYVSKPINSKRLFDEISRFVAKT